MKKIKEERVKFQIPGNKHIDFKIRKTNTNVGRHWHNYFELEIIVGGYGKEVIGGKEFEVFPGCCYLLSMEDYHSVEIYETLEILHLSFDENFLTEEQLERILNNKSLPFSVLEPENLEVIKNLFLVCKAEYDAFSGESRCLKKLIECLLIKVLDSFSMSEKGNMREMSEALRSAVLYIHTHFQKPISLDEVAQVAKYNASYFSSIFSSEFRVTFSEYLTSLRINYAKRLLRSTDEGIEQIGKRCGFCSPSTFLQAFKKSEGKTPSAYRAYKK